MKAYLLASLAALALLMTGCNNPFKGIAEQKKPYHCPDGWVPGDLETCSPAPAMRMIPQPRSKTTACKIVPDGPGGPSPLGSVDRDGTVRWWWAGAMSPQMQVKINKACRAAVLSAKPINL